MRAQLIKTFVSSHNPLWTFCLNKKLERQKRIQRPNCSSIRVRFFWSMGERIDLRGKYLSPNLKHTALVLELPKRRTSMSVPMGVDCNFDQCSSTKASIKFQISRCDISDPDHPGGAPLIRIKRHEWVWLIGTGRVDYHFDNLPYKRRVLVALDPEF